MSTRIRLILAVIFAVALVMIATPKAAPAQVEIETAPEQREPRARIVPPGGLYEITRPRESDFYPEDIRVRHDPAFVEPMTGTRQTGPNSAVKYGVSGWTSPQTPVGQSPSANREVPGWFALGISLIWDVPVLNPGPGR